MKSYEIKLSQIAPLEGSLMGYRNPFRTLPETINYFHRDEKVIHDPLWVHSRFVLITAVSGKGGVIVDGELKVLSGAEAILIFPFQSHRFSRIDDHPFHWVFTVFTFEEESFLAPLRGRVIALLKDGEEFFLRVVSCAKDGMKSAQENGNDATLSHFPLGIELAHYLLQLKHCLLLKIESDTLGSESSYAQRDKKSDVQEMIEILCRYIHTHLNTQITLAELASLTPFSMTHMRRIFKQVTGETVQRFIQTQRINLAATLLIQSSKPIAEIAQMTGYVNVYSFSRTFESRMKMPPGKYRRKNMTKTLL